VSWPRRLVVGDGEAVAGGGGVALVRVNTEKTNEAKREETEG